MLDLQAFSRHRDIRSLSRYTHLCAGAITAKLEEAKKDRQKKLGNKGRMRLKQPDPQWLGGDNGPSTRGTSPPSSRHPRPCRSA